MPTSTRDVISCGTELSGAKRNVTHPPVVGDARPKAGRHQSSVLPFHHGPQINRICAEILGLASSNLDDRVLLNVMVPRSTLAGWETRYAALTPCQEAAIRHAPLLEPSAQGEHTFLERKDQGLRILLQSRVGRISPIETDDCRPRHLRPAEILLPRRLEIRYRPGRLSSLLAGSCRDQS